MQIPSRRQNQRPESFFKAFYAGGFKIRAPSAGAMSLMLLELLTRVTTLTRTGREGEFEIEDEANDVFRDAGAVPAKPGAAAGASSPINCVLL